jgi:hypothetical protein
MELSLKIDGDKVKITAKDSEKVVDILAAIMMAEKSLHNSLQEYYKGRKEVTQEELKEFTIGELYSIGNGK